MAIQDADLNGRQFREANPILLSQMLDNGFIDFIIVFFQDRDKLCCNIFN
jgi:hypothetical protein